MRNQYFPVFAYAIILLCGCNTYTYVNQMPNTPMFNQKGDVAISGTLGTNHVEGQAAFAISDHLGFTGNAYAGSGAAGTAAGVTYFGRYGSVMNYDLQAGFSTLHVQYEKDQVPLLPSGSILTGASYSGLYFQPSYYFQSGDQSQQGVAFRVNFNFTDKYSYRIQSYEGKGNGGYEQWEAEDRLQNVVTGLYYSLKKTDRSNLLFYNLQLGLNVASGFDKKITYTNTNAIPTQTREELHAPLMQTLAINFSVGINLGSIFHRKKEGANPIDRNE